MTPRDEIATDAGSDDAIRARVQEVLASLRDPAITYFPIRHHSPACARHLERWIEEHRPSAVLVEAPASASELIDLLLDKDCVPPVALFTRFVDRSGHLARSSPDAAGPDSGETSEVPVPVAPRFAAYSPFCETSPEWVALRTGRRIGARLELIDLDFPEQILARARAAHVLRTTGSAHLDQAGVPGDPAVQVESLTADPHLQHATLLRELGRRLGCRDPDELWDHLFEAPEDLDPDAFIDRVGTYCALARFSTPEYVLSADATLAREAHMSSRIRAAITQRDRREDEGPLLVVTGGFHSVELPALIAAGEAQHPPATPFRDDEIGTWLVPYSFDRLDALGGYASGMPSPGFYDRLARARRADTDGTEEASALAADLLVEVARRTRELDLPTAVSTADAIAAVTHMEGLAALRGHRSPQREDLLDAIRSVYVKGDMGSEGEVLFAIVRSHLAGDRVGCVPPQAGRPPLLGDFREEARRLRLPTDTIEEKTFDLDLYRKSRDRERSRLFHRLDFLAVPYASFLRGPDFVRGRETGRRIETWRVAWSPNVDGSLLEVSDLGPTVADAATARLYEEIAELGARAGRSAGSGAVLLLRALRLGLHDRLPNLLPLLRELVEDDGDLVSLAGCLDTLDLVSRQVGPLEASGLRAIPDLIQLTWRRACHLVDGIGACPDEAVESIVGALVSLREQLAEHGEADETPAASVLDSDLLTAALGRLLTAPEDSVHGAIAGAAAGLLYSLGEIDAMRLDHEVRGRLAGAVAEPQRACGVLRGLLRTAREVSWQTEGVVRTLDVLLQGWTEDDFHRALPQLRLAFTDLTPREIVRVADRVAAEHDGRPLGSLIHADLGETDLQVGLELGRRARDVLIRDGLVPAEPPDQAEVSE